MRLVFTVAFTLLQPVLALQVTSGLADHQVVQRTSKDSARLSLSGESLADGTVEVRIDGPWRKLAEARGGKWTGDLPNLPVGGPYRIELRIGSEQVTIDDVLVGDLWVLAGQSNMQGDGLLATASNGDPRVHSFDPSGHWTLAKEPLHTQMGGKERGAGLGLPFALEMVRSTGVPVGLLPCARGGTAIAEWSPAERDRADSLYGLMYRRVLAAGGRVAGMLWYQGEADGKPGRAEPYQERFEELIAAVRRDFRDPRLPFYFAQIGRNVSDSNVAEWSAVREAQRRVEQKVPFTGMVASLDLPMVDAIHISTEGLKTLGHRFAVVASGTARSGPRPEAAVAGDGFIRLKLSGVNGRIIVTDRLAGFTVANVDGRMRSRIYSVHPDPEDPSSLLLYFDDGRIPPRFLWYGYGKDPYCNVRDAAGMALPAFGPISIDGQTPLR